MAFRCHLFISLVTVDLFILMFSKKIFWVCVNTVIVYQLLILFFLLSLFDARRY